MQEKTAPATLRLFAANFELDTRTELCFDIIVIRTYIPLKIPNQTTSLTHQPLLVEQVFFGESVLMNPVQDDAYDHWHEASLRVRYAETDKMGVVYHANYLIWFEIGRTEYCRARGFSYRDMEESENAFLVVAESYCRYKAPAYYDDVLIVRTHITELRRRSLRFGYEIIRESDGVVIAEGETGHVVTDGNARVRSMPASFAELLLAPPLEVDEAGQRVPEMSPE